MDIQASIRLEALKPPARVKNYYKFYASLGPKERKFFALVLPELISSWYSGSFMKRNKSERLTSTLEARTYPKVDAIAVALGHLKKAFPFKAAPVLYRATALPSKEFKTATVGSTLILTKNNTFSPILSFSEKMLKDFEEADNVTVKWKTEQRLVLATTEWLLALSKGFADMFLELAEVHAEEDNEKYIDFYERSFGAWSGMSTLKGYRNEFETIVFLPGNESIKTTVIRQGFKRTPDSSLDKILHELYIYWAKINGVKTPVAYVKDLPGSDKIRVLTPDGKVVDLYNSELGTKKVLAQKFLNALKLSPDEFLKRYIKAKKAK